MLVGYNHKQQKNAMKAGYSAFFIVLLFVLLINSYESEAPPLMSVHEKPAIADFMGINVHSVEVNMELLTPIFHQVRDYHTVVWSLPEYEDSRADFPYSRMEIGWHDRSGRVGHHEGLVNWGKIYDSWYDLGFEVNVSLMVVQKPADQWNNLEEDAYQYGYDFAKYFGTPGLNIVRSVEIGNEPVPYWDLNDYMKVFRSMARGVRDADPEMKILTAAAQASRPDEFSVPVSVYRPYSELYDVIKVHVYSLKQGWPSFERSYPEDPSIDYLNIVKNTIKWRNRHAPEKEIWITEFGYDSSTKKPEHDSEWAQWVDVSDEVQAQWLLRSYLEFSRLDVQRAYVYWFNDHDEPSFHAASGIMRLNQPKKSFWTLKQMRNVLGDYRFNREVKRVTRDVHVYEYVNKNDSNDIIWAAWSPTGYTNSDGETRFKEITLPMPGNPDWAQRMAMHENEETSADFSINGANIEFTVSESPMYIRFTRAGL